jgi:hypothetical protein
MNLRIKFSAIAVLSVFLLITLSFACKKQPAKSVSNAPQEKVDSKPTEVVEKKSDVEETKIPSNENKIKEESKKVKDDDKAFEDLPKRLLVSFYSIGGGIDLKNAQLFDNFMVAYKSSNGKSITYERVPWGREGELDYCIVFDGMSTSDIDEFIVSAKAKISDCKMVHFKLDEECKRKR